VRGSIEPQREKISFGFYESHTKLHNIKEKKEDDSLSKKP